MANDCKPLRGTEQIAEVLIARIAKVQEGIAKEQAMAEALFAWIAKEQAMRRRLCDSINRRTNC